MDWIILAPETMKKEEAEMICQIGKARLKSRYIK
jgi:hypothetical protein